MDDEEDDEDDDRSLAEDANLKEEHVGRLSVCGRQCDYFLVRHSEEQPDFGISGVSQARALAPTAWQLWTRAARAKAPCATRRGGGR